MNIGKLLYLIGQSKRERKLVKDEREPFACENCGFKGPLKQHDMFLYCHECDEAETRREKLLQAEKEFNEG